MQAVGARSARVVQLLLTGMVAALVGNLIVHNPGMSVSGWIVQLGPVVAAGMALVVVSWPRQFRLAALLGSPGGGHRLALLASAVVAVGLSSTIVANPTDAVVALLAAAALALFLLSLLRIVEGRATDAIGLLFLVLPLLTYVSFELVRVTGTLTTGWLTLKVGVLVVFVFLFYSIRFGGGQGRLVGHGFNHVVLAFAAVTFLSALYSGDVAYSVQRWLFEIAYPCSVYFLIVNGVTSRGDVARLLRYLAGSVCLTLVIVLYYFVKYGASGSVENRHALYLNFADGVLIANVLIMVLPVVVTLLVLARRADEKVALMGAMALGIVALVLSFARAAQMTMAIGLAAFLFRRETRKGVLVLVGATALAVLLMPALVEPYVSKYEGLGSVASLVDASSMLKRFGGWTAALGMFHAHPLIGIGIGRFSREYANFGSLYYSSWASDFVPMISAHNLYLTYLAETGVFGAATLAMVVVGVLVAAVRSVREVGSGDCLPYGILVALCLFFFNSLVDGITFAYGREIEKGLVFWTLVALVMSYRTALRDRKVRGAGLNTREEDDSSPTSTRIETCSTR